jgi:hypothetical protein
MCCSKCSTCRTHSSCCTLLPAVTTLEFHFTIECGRRSRDHGCRCAVQPVFFNGVARGAAVIIMQTWPRFAVRIDALLQLAVMFWRRLSIVTYTYLML